MLDLKHSTRSNALTEVYADMTPTSSPFCTVFADAPDCDLQAESDASKYWTSAQVREKLWSAMKALAEVVKIRIQLAFLLLTPTDTRTAGAEGEQASFRAYEEQSVRSRHLLMHMDELWCIQTAFNCMPFCALHTFRACMHALFCPPAD